jgi:hypothetical protein
LANPSGTMTVGTTAIPFTQLNSATSVSAGTGISIAGNVITNTGVISLATPTGTIGTNAVAGTSTSAMRADGAPALSLAIAPTWTQPHTFGGGVVMGDAKDIAAGTTTGTKIGTAANQKWGFFGATPVVQQANSSDILTSLSNLGLISGAGAAPLTTSGAVVLTGGLTVTKAFVETPVALAVIAGHVATNAALGNIFDINGTGDFQLDNPTNPSHGQKVMWRPQQTAAAAITFDTAFDLAGQIIRLTNGSAKIDIIGAIYDSRISKWCVFNPALGY